jgi:hypothetical protein
MSRSAPDDLTGHDRRPTAQRQPRTAVGEFHVFLSAGEASGTATQLGFEVDDIEAVFAELGRRGVVFEPDEIVDVGGNYPSKGAGERGAWFRDSEGNVLGLAQSTG